VAAHSSVSDLWVSAAVGDAEVSGGTADQSQGGVSSLEAQRLAGSSASGDAETAGAGECE
jgi:hypothetical protein